MTSYETDPTWVSALAHRMYEKGHGEAHEHFDRWELSEEVLSGQPGWVDDAQVVFEHRDRARRYLSELRQFAVFVALNSVDTAILGMPTKGSDEYAEGYLQGLRSARLELSQHLRRPPHPRPELIRFLKAPYRPVPTPPPRVDVVQENVRKVLERRQPTWSATELESAADDLGAYLVRLRAESLNEARKEIKALHRQGGKLLDDLDAPGDLHVTESVTGRELADQLRDFAAAVRQDATPGPTFAAGYYVATEHVARMSEQRATDLRFIRKAE